MFIKRWFCGPERCANHLVRAINFPEKWIQREVAGPRHSQVGGS